MPLIKGFVIAFAMYSKIPMPRVEWDRESMRFALCFLPLVGAVVGAAQVGWWFAARILGVQAPLYACAAAVLPLVLTGGIHMDGLIDTSDARSSYGDQQKKLQILGDPHVGAFGVIHCAAYLLLQLGLFAQLYSSQAPIFLVALSYPLSRGLAGLCILLFRKSKQEGLVSTFVGNSSRAAAAAATALFCLATLVCLFLLNPLCGGAVLAGQAVLLLWWLGMSRRQFGGVSGDLAGYLVQLSELVTLGAAVLCSFF